MQETEALRAGRWEAFLAKPTLARLLDLRETAPAGEEQRQSMQRAAEHIRAYLAHPPSRQGGVQFWRDEDDVERPASIDQSVLAHACLLAEEFEAARQLAAGEKVLGWSSSYTPQGLVLSFLLLLLSDKSPDTLPPNLAQLWTWALSNSLGFSAGFGGEKDRTIKRLEQAYGEITAAAGLTEERKQAFLAWCLDVAQQRANAIVGGKHRKSYNKAAVVITACAEVLRLRGKQAEAGLLINEISQRFPRHRAFQAELRTAIQRMERDPS